MNVLDVHVGPGRAHLADARGLRGQAVDPLEIVLDAGLVGQREGVEHGVRAAPHRHVKDERVVDALHAEDVQRPQVLVHALLERARRIRRQLEACGIDNGTRAFAVGPDRGGNGAVPRQREADGLPQAIHRVGGEHARAGTAGRAGAHRQPLEPTGG